MLLSSSVLALGSRGPPGFEEGLAERGKPEESRMAPPGGSLLGTRGTLRPRRKRDCQRKISGPNLHLQFM